jgi:hypothetical protein
MEILEVDIFWGVSTFEKELHHLQFATFKSRTFVSFKKPAKTCLPTYQFQICYIKRSIGTFQYVSVNFVFFKNCFAIFLRTASHNLSWRETSSITNKYQKRRNAQKMVCKNFNSLFVDLLMFYFILSQTMEGETTPVIKLNLNVLRKAFLY